MLSTARSLQDLSKRAPSPQGAVLSNNRISLDSPDTSPSSLMGLETICHESQEYFLKPIWVLGSRGAFAIWACSRTQAGEATVQGQGLEPEKYMDSQARGADLM